ncbi:MAG: general secretion pathway protein L [Parasphingorhabdus sp.]|jgi:general secretion pathway protein L|tara:strand:+ start:2126 stop:3259 length:1134 start_codon:yes stop_codon:yes gene_type:complete
MNVDHIHNLDQRLSDESDPLKSMAGANSLAMALWVPSERISMHLIDVPSAPERKWSALIPWMLEDRVLQPVETMHFVINRHSGNNQLQVIAVSHEDMQQWQQVAHNAGVAVNLMVPDFLALPYESGRITVGWRNGLLLVRSGTDTGFAAKPNLGWALIDSLLAASNISPRLSISLPDETLVPDHLRDLADINDASIDWQFVDMPIGFNLLTGTFKSASSVTYSKGWLPTIGLAALAIGLLVVYLQISSNALRINVQALEKQSLSSYSRLFRGRAPEVAQIIGSAEQRLTKLRKQKAAIGAGSMAALVAIEDLMTACNCDLRSLSADAQGIRLEIDNGAKLKAKTLSIPGYQIALTQLPDGGPESVLLVVRPNAEAIK